MKMHLITVLFIPLLSYEHQSFLKDAVVKLKRKFMIDHQTINNIDLMNKNLEFI